MAIYNLIGGIISTQILSINDRYKNYIILTNTQNQNKQDEINNNQYNTDIYACQLE